MRVLCIAAVSAVAIMLAACADPKSTELPADVSKWDALKPALDKLTPEERELFVKFGMRKAMKGAPLFGAMAGDTEARTIGDAIQNQRDFMAAAQKKDAEEKALKAKLQAERELAVKAMRDVVSVVLLNKKLNVKTGYGGMELERGLAVTFGYKNNGSKDIAGVKGTVIAKDLFGDTLSRFLISNDETIKPGQVVYWEGFRSTKFAFGDNNDEKLAGLADDKFRIEWEPQMIVFADGSKMEAPK